MVKSCLDSDSLRWNYSGEILLREVRENKDYLLSCWRHGLEKINLMVSLR